MVDPKGEPIDYGRMRIASVPLLGSKSQRDKDMPEAIVHLKEWAAREYPKGTIYEIRMGVDSLMPRPEIGVWREVAILIPVPEDAWTDLGRITDTGWYAIGGYYFIERSEI